MRALILTVAVLFATVSTAKAESFAKITDQAVISECGTDCHMAFPPETLPSQSWKNMFNNLSDHFGDDASLDPATIQPLLNYYVQNASDVLNTRAARKWRTSGTPDRIQTAPRFKNKHTGCSADMLAQVVADPKVKTWANCEACHPAIVKTGDAEENVRFLPRALHKCFDD